MLYVMIGMLRDEVRHVPQDVQLQTNEFLGQSFVEIRAAGELQDANGIRAGMMVIIECESREKAEAFFSGSPYRNAGLYADSSIFEFVPEVGP